MPLGRVYMTRYFPFLKKLKKIKFGRRRRAIFRPVRYGRNKQMLIVNVLAVLLIIFFVYSIFGGKGGTNIPAERVSAFQIPFKTFIELSAISEKYELNLSELLTLFGLENGFFPSKTAVIESYELEQKYVLKYADVKKKYVQKDIKTYSSLFGSVLEDIKFFPVGIIEDKFDPIPYIFGDSWNIQKNGKQGVDIFDRENIKGRLPIISMTDGVVNEMGYKDESGYFINIQSKNGNIYCYEHLDRFYDNLAKGLAVKAGAVIGFMGNTAKGKDRVHLGLCILVNTSLSKDGLWLNPYPFLKLLEGKSQLSPLKN